MIDLLKRKKIDYTYIFFSAFFIVLNLLYFKKIYKELEYSNAFLLISIVVTIIEIILLVVYKLITKKGFTPEKVFLVFGIIIGLCYLIAIPLNMPPDEPTHFKREYEISSGHIISEKNEKGFGGRKLPKSITSIFKVNGNNIKYSELLNKFKTKYSNKKIFQKFGVTALYSPISYFPQVLGIIIGRILHLPMIFIIYLARLANLACYLAIMYFCIKIIPINKNIITLLAFLPMSMQGAISCQPDALTMATAFLIICFVLSKMNNKKKLTKKEIITISILSIILSQCKIVYIPICLILYLIPEKCFSSKKEKYKIITLIVAISILLNLIWLGISATYLAEFREGVNSKLQLKYILTHPKDFIFIIFNTINDLGMFYLYSSLGMQMEQLTVGISQIYLTIYLFYMFYVSIMDNNGKNLIKKNSKLVISFISITCIILIFTSLYIQWNAYKSEIILGVQGRYFLPLYIFIPLLLEKNRIKEIKENNINKYSYLLIIMISFYVLMMIVSHHL